MTALYLLPHSILILIIMLLSAAAVLQTVCTLYGFFRLQYRKKNILETLLNGAVLGQLLMLLLFAAETAFNSSDGFLVVHRYTVLRTVLFAVLTALSLIITWKQKILLPLSIPAAALITLPAAETLSFRAFPILYFIAVVFWLFRAVNLLWIFLRQRKEALSAFSVKEAVDTLDFGLLFCREDGASRGQILLCNRKMQDLMFTLTGKMFFNGDDFYRMLTEGKVLPGCLRSEMEPLPVYRLPDGSVWQFDLKELQLNKAACTLLIASDTTESRRATVQLYDRNKQLQQRNDELKTMLENLEQVCRTEETLHAKSRVHDLLGQRITLMLRFMREHREPDEELLASFANGLPKELTDPPADREYSLKNLAKNFQGLGVTVHTDGQLPKTEPLGKTFFEICAEATTNAVHHGYATEIFITLRRANGTWVLHVTDNGIPVPEPVSEGGGLQGMRRRIDRLGGTFSFGTRPHFYVRAEVPEENLPSC